MKKADDRIRIPGIDDRPMSGAQFEQIWKRLAEQEEEIFVGDSAENDGLRPMERNKPLAV